MCCLFWAGKRERQSGAHYRQERHNGEGRTQAVMIPDPSQKRRREPSKRKGQTERDSRSESNVIGQVALPEDYHGSYRCKEYETHRGQEQGQKRHVTNDHEEWKEQGEEPEGGHGDDLVAEAIGGSSTQEVPHYPGTIGEVLEEKAAANGKFGPAAEKAREMARQEGVSLRSHVIVGHEVKTIVEFIKKYGFDLLVIGFMGHSALYNRVMGGTCQSLVRLAPCSVYVVK